ncbi:type-F conjugative transfer system secretin TraK [Sutterella sp.]|uniref:TraK domain-containing protein n=1 Tax=Sutterella sp. TaxID=1981025 RepID=UPI0026DEBD52|nr:type-F conjugative transfer system secretin TraK [Sutterella sp.]MDO5531909.1 type-F conjugative transfer system secretin TraK [Sutterella sp.]
MNPRHCKSPPRRQTTAIARLTALSSCLLLSLGALSANAAASESADWEAFPQDGAPSLATATTSPSRSAGAASYRRAKEASASLTFEVPLMRPTRLAIMGERILSAVYDRNDLSVQTDARLGQVYVQPLREGDIALYLSTESGESISIILVSSELTGPQNIVLQRSSAPRAGTDTRSVRVLEPLRASNYEEAVKRLVRHALLDEEAPDVMRRGACPRPSQSLTRAVKALEALKPRVKSCWASTGMAAAVIAVRNPRLGTAEINDAALIGPTSLAVAVDRTTLSFGETATVIFVEAGNGE